VKIIKDKTNPAGVVIATITFYPEISGTGQVLTDLAVSLARQGLHVRVYTAQPHYYEKHVPHPKQETVQGIDIRRIASTTFDKNRRLGRILNWASFAFFAFWNLLFDRSPYPLLLVSSPPVLPFIGPLLKWLRRKPYVVLVHDVYPDIGVKLGFFKPNGFTVKIWNALNRITYRNASKIIVLAEDMARIILEQIKTDKQASFIDGKVEVIHNWADETLIHPVPRDENRFLQKNPLPYTFVVQYSGNLGFNHDLEPLIDAAQSLEHSGMGFVFIGEGGKKEKLQSMVSSSGLKNVLFFPFQPRQDLPDLLSASDLSVVALEQGLEGLAVPSKFYSILASGRPILALLGGECEMARIIRQYNCGFVVSERNPEKVVKILQECLRDRDKIRQMGENARRCFEAHFTRKQAADKYRELLKAV